MRWLMTLSLAVLFAAGTLAQPPGGGRGFGMMMGGGAMLLANKSVQTELKLNDEQKDKITKYADEAQKKMGELFQSGDREKIQEAMKEMREEVQKFTKETLNPDQQKRLAQITLQQGGIMAAVASEETSKKLNLTSEQKDKIKKVGEEMRADMQELFQGGGNPRDPETQKKVQELRKEGAKKAMEVLNDEQKKTWEEMTGKPFEIKMEAPRRPGGDRPPV